MPQVYRRRTRSPKPVTAQPAGSGAVCRVQWLRLSVRWGKPAGIYSGTVTEQTAPARLDLHQDVALLTADIIDIFSVSGEERRLADAVEHALRSVPQLEVVRDGDSIIARTNLGRAERVILAGHLDTVPLPTTVGSLGTVPSYWPSGAPGEGILYGRGATDGQ